jgi:hypothetical protein
MHLLGNKMRIVASREQACERSWRSLREADGVVMRTEPSSIRHRGVTHTK